MEKPVCRFIRRYHRYKPFFLYLLWRTIENDDGTLCSRIHGILHSATIRNPTFLFSRMTEV